jgi:hypothetical protein
LRASSRKRSYLCKLGEVRDRKPAALLAAAGLLVAVLVGACGSSSKPDTGRVTAEAYVNQVCASVGEWLRAVETRSAQIGKELTPGSTPTHAKQALEGLMDSSVADSERVVSGLHAAGTPNVKNGEQIAGALSGSFEQATAALQNVQAQVRSLPTNEPRTFLTAAKRVAGSVQSSLAGIGTGLSTLHSPELQQAAKQSAACRNLGAA